jgi:small basic protein (TIGR04137 family)
VEPAHDQRGRQDEAGADLRRGRDALPRVRAGASTSVKRARPDAHERVPTNAVDFYSRPGSPPFISGKFMSQHRSLKGASTIAAKRNVLKRFERVELLKKRGVFKPGDKVIGLPKTKPDA